MPLCRFSMQHPSHFMDFRHQLMTFNASPSPFDAFTWSFNASLLAFNASPSPCYACLSPFNPFPSPFKITGRTWMSFCLTSASLHFVLTLLRRPLVPHHVLSSLSATLQPIFVAHAPPPPHCPLTPLHRHLTRFRRSLTPFCRPLMHLHQ